MWNTNSAKEYRLTCEELGERWLTCDGVKTSISIRRFVGYSEGTWRDDYIVYSREFFGSSFRVGTSKTVEGAFNIAVNYWECMTEGLNNG